MLIQVTLLTVCESSSDNDGSTEIPSSESGSEQATPFMLLLLNSGVAIHSLKEICMISSSALVQRCTQAVMHADWEK